MKLPDKCSKISVLYKNGDKEDFTPTSKIDEFEDCYEFTEAVEEKTNLVILMKSEIRKIEFQKAN